MTRKEYQQFHGFSDEDMQMIDDCKKIFNGAIMGVYTNAEMKNMNENIQRDNKINIDRLWIK